MICPCQSKAVLEKWDNFEEQELLQRREVGLSDWKRWWAVVLVDWKGQHRGGNPYPGEAGLEVLIFGPALTIERHERYQG